MCIPDIDTLLMTMYILVYSNLSPFAFYYDVPAFLS